MPERRPRAEGHEQQIPDGHRRQHERQMDDTVEDRLAAELAPGEHHAQRKANGKSANTAVSATLRLRVNACSSASLRIPMAYASVRETTGSGEAAA